MRHFIVLCLFAADVCVAQTNPTALRARDQAASASVASQEDAVRRAALDYLEGFYEGDTAKLVRSLRPEMLKYGFYKGKDATGYAGERMTYDEAIAYARRFKANKNTTPASAPREVTIFDVQGPTASAKVRAWWGTDYLLLGNYDGKWMISHILWQGP